MKQTYSNNLSKQAGSRRSKWRFIPALAVMATIYMFSSRSGDDLNSVLPWFQKLFPAMQSFDWGHFVAYFGLALALDYGFGARGDSWKGKLLIVAICGIYGVTDEYHQSFVGGRSPDLWDIRNDCIGAAIAVLVIAIPAIRRRWRRLAY
ncbi:VanZ family protein [Paenibacillus oenotherae]|uniref:VanZ family protein n=1 Tax=Paenibacillus oenotherae TaxID=1435645 RepID=A0ABS7D2P7_9BACL|nr:VanZ family protein [Paenibacillus oenotherae]MBW7474215.1 VanZ family protein [Paenibacillus oenotherae]